MDYLNSIINNNSPFQIIFNINFLSLIIYFISVIIAVNKTNKDQKKWIYLFLSDEVEDIIIIYKNSSHFIIFALTSIIIFFLSFWFGITFFITTSTYALLIILNIDNITSFFRYYLRLNNKNDYSYIMKSAVIKPFFVYITIKISSYMCIINNLENILFDKNNHALKTIIIALLIILIYGLVYIISNSLYFILAFSINRKATIFLSEKIEKYYVLNEKNDNNYEKRMKDICYDLFKLNDYNVEDSGNLLYHNAYNIYDFEKNS